MTDPQPAVPLRLEVVSEPVQAALGPDLRWALLSHPVVRAQYPNADLWVVSVDTLDKDDEPNARFRAILADMAGNDVVEAEGRLWELDNLAVFPTTRPRPPTEEEHAWAVGALRVDEEMKRRMEAGELEAYRPIPPLANAQDADGSVDRAIALGLRETAPDGTVRHRIVAVRAADGEVVEDGDRVPRLPIGDRECGSPEGVGPAATPAAAAGEPQARVRVWRGDELLWDLVVVRPSASSGTNGSGVELRLVHFQRARVLHRAHVPIANLIDDGACGAVRVWLNEEASFEAEGDEPVPGFRVCTGPPATILDRGEGGGGFRGVALWLDGEELHIVSQLEAGWHRYVSEWSLHADGTIRPRMGFGAVRNPCTCHPHTHHVYWRLDFDVMGPDLNLVQEHNDPRLPGQLAPWHTIHYEVRRPRDPARRRQWRVRTIRSAHGYTVVPGDNDGTADDFGAGDVWVLVHHGEELDDGQGLTTDPAHVRAGLDRFVSGELVERQDVVLWYAAHAQVAHVAPDAPDAPVPARAARVGPDLRPFNWKPPLERTPHIPLEPPPQPGPDDDDEDEDE